jgi:hypothetical protein
MFTVVGLMSGVMLTLGFGLQGTGAGGVLVTFGAILGLGALVLESQL